MANSDLNAQRNPTSLPASDPQPAAARLLKPRLIVRRRSSIPVRRSPAGDSGRPTLLDWGTWLQLIERKRRLLQRQQALCPAAPLPISLLIQATCSNFKLDGIVTTELEVTTALSPKASGRKFRSRTAQRIRNHIAILHSIEMGIRIGRPLKTSAIVRWYTSVSSGLSMTSLSGDCMTRLDQVVRGINSPQLRLQPAIQEIVRRQLEVLTDPLFPSFNGILSRMLLRYHLGRCALPFIVFPQTNDSVTTLANISENALTLQLLVALDESYELLLNPE